MIIGRECARVDRARDRLLVATRHAISSGVRLAAHLGAVFRCLPPRPRYRVLTL
jgi:hypothetical protein